MDDIVQRVLNQENDRDKSVRAMFYAYVRMYEVAGGDFKRLVSESPQKDGRIEIPFDDYFISIDDFEDILKETKRKFGLTKYEYKKVTEAVTLGCSPRFRL